MAALVFAWLEDRVPSGTVVRVRAVAPLLRFSQVMDDGRRKRQRITEPRIHKAKPQASECFLGLSSSGMIR